MSPKEKAYDDKIAPLMTQIIAVCKAEGIGIAALFALGPDPDTDGEQLTCYTCISPKDDDKGNATIIRVREAMIDRPLFARISVITEKPGATRKT